MRSMVSRLPASGALPLSVFIFLMILASSFTPAFAAWPLDGVPVCSETAEQSGQRIASDGAGGAIIVWKDFRGTYTDIYAQRVDADGNILWTPGGVRLSFVSEDSNSPKIVTDGTGGAIVCWYDLDNYRVFAQRLDPGGNELWTLGGITVFSHPSCNASYPEMIPDGNGGAVLAWMVYVTIGVEHDIYCQWLTAAGTTVYPANGIRITQLDGSEKYPAIVTDGCGGVIVTWFRIGANNDIYAQRLDELGNLQWDSSPLAICTATGDQQTPKIASGGGIEAIIVWSDKRNGSDWDLYTQKVDTSGTVAWAADGMPLIAETNDQTDPSVAVPVEGELVVVWRDTRTGEHDIYAQKIDTDGTLLWNSQGIPVCVEPGDQFNPECIPDGEGGVLITWGDERSGTRNIYAQRLNSSGSSQWGPGGVSVGPASGLQAGPMLSANEENGTVITWYDERGADRDIYAQRLNRNGYRIGDYAPVIHNVRDMPGDQGGYVYLTWYRSEVDDISRGGLISEYSVWRAISAEAAALSMAKGAEIISLDTELNDPVPDRSIRREMIGLETYFWEYVASAAAYYLGSYGMSVPTMFDSSSVCDEHSYFQVIAHTSDPMTFYVSWPASGYSVDNLAPAAPLGLAGEQIWSPEGILLTWDPNIESDLAGYKIYRGTSSGFTPGAGNFVTSTPDTMTLDGDWSWEAGYWYKVAAVDIHGNESLFAVIGPDMVTGDDPAPLPDATFLAQNFPNPFNPITNIGFGIKKPGHISLRIYDAAGRLVATLVDESRPAGRYTTEWNGQNTDGSSAASGVYFYRLISKEFEETKKMILLR